MKKNEAPIIVEHVFNQSAARVWNAITDLNEMKLWFFDNIPAYKPIVGFKTQFTVKSEERVFPHQWEITEVIPLKKIVTNWSYEGYFGSSFVVFELSEQNNKTKLIVSTIVTEDFPDNIPEFERESCIGGWNYFIKNNLANYLKA